MPLRYFKHKKTGTIIETLDGSPGKQYCEVIKAPSGKFMECVNKATNKSRPKDLKKVLTERARNHSRDVYIDDNIQLNKDNNLGVSANFLNENGQRRKKIDDL